jgi:hypothetical protein
MKKALLMFVVAGLLSACASDPFKIPQTPAGKECTAVKDVEGSSGGFLLFAVIPCGKNGMVERAYKEALELGGGDVLLNAVYEDRWAWTPIGNLFFVSVKGTAAKCN